MREVFDEFINGATENEVKLVIKSIDNDNKKKLEIIIELMRLLL
ncbi:hypothetical protein VQL36_14690 [Chengkuizengella sp. SCS-71B]